ncbi:MAG: nuclease A inhibitor family protein [Pyrinomonadaceae bacterium]|nr:nuclease A inhibitor family protein [Pyrinomonadaceae bacterium]MCX7639123.1 nuclease A inhibitor family protein [Pyrinomonadaceae bacterium]MDW8303656.1 nuclease A inhibitor family protein [Acidobacteriota bacterium]
MQKESMDFIFDSMKSMTEGLYYMSETDAEILAFKGGIVDRLDKESFAKSTALRSEEIEERDFEKFFERLTKVQDWFGEEERKNAERFKKLRDFMKNHLRDLRVFRVGKIEIEIYVVGIDSKGRIYGFRTQAVET